MPIFFFNQFDNLYRCVIVAVMVRKMHFRLFCSIPQSTYDHLYWELVPGSGSQASVSLSHSDVQIGTTEVTLRIQSSKTDPFRRGASVRLAATGASLCPVRAVSDYQTYCPASSPKSAFLLQASGTPLTRSQFVDTLRKCLNVAGVPFAQRYSAHSFRTGAATTAAMKGVPEWLIQACGRWSSDCFRLCTRAQPSQLDQVTRALAVD